MVIKTGFLVPAISVLTLAGCLLDEKPPVDNTPNDPEPAACTALCRVETPEDTLALTPDQKEQLIDVIESVDDSATVSVTSFDLEALADSGTRHEALKELQMTLLGDMKIPLDPASLAGLPLDSMLASVRITATTDGTTSIQWSGTIADVRVEMVFLNVRNDEFLGGYAVVDGKVFLFQSLGGAAVALIYDPETLWMNGCPSFSKVARGQLTCVTPVP